MKQIKKKIIIFFLCLTTSNIYAAQDGGIFSNFKRYFCCCFQTSTDDVVPFTPSKKEEQDEALAFPKTGRGIEITQLPQLTPDEIAFFKKKIERYRQRRKKLKREFLTSEQIVFFNEKIAKFEKEFELCFNFGELQKKNNFCFPFIKKKNTDQLAPPNKERSVSFGAIQDDSAAFGGFLFSDGSDDELEQTAPVSDQVSVFEVDSERSSSFRKTSYDSNSDCEALEQSSEESSLVDLSRRLIRLYNCLLVIDSELSSGNKTLNSQDYMTLQKIKNDIEEMSFNTESHEPKIFLKFEVIKKKIIKIADKYHKDTSQNQSGITDDDEDDEVAEANLKKHRKKERALSALVTAAFIATYIRRKSSPTLNPISSSSLLKQGGEQSTATIEPNKYKALQLKIQKILTQYKPSSTQDYVYLLGAFISLCNCIYK